MTRRTLHIVILLLASIITRTALVSQPTPLTRVTLDECLNAIETAHPLYKLPGLIEKSREYNLDNASRGYLPRVSIVGQATYQSDVVSVPISFPGFKIESPSKDQYRLQAEVAQTIYDGGFSGKQSDLVHATSNNEGAKVNIDVYKIKERVYQIYFAVLLLRSQQRSLGYQQDNLKTVINTLTAAQRNGTALQSSVDVVQADLLRTQQRMLELTDNSSAYIQIMQELTHLSLSDSTEFIQPPDSETQGTITRPELGSMITQTSLVDVQIAAIDSRYMPKFEAFVQGGYARPGLNMLKNEFAAYYIAGIRMNWSLTDWYASTSERQTIAVQKEMIDIQRQAFLLNTQTQLIQLRKDEARYTQQLALDQDIVRLRGNVRTTTQKQLDGGISTANDYIKAVNDEEAAIRDRETHTIQRIMTKYSQLLTLGK